MRRFSSVTKWSFLLFIMALEAYGRLGEGSLSSMKEFLIEEKPPVYLYKVLSKEGWNCSQQQASVQLTSDDAEFIHFSTQDQLDRIINKYWADVPEFVVLKIKTAALPGKLVFEANPGGVNKYYHLYNGSIPLQSVVDSKVIASAHAAIPNLAQKIFFYQNDD